MYDGTSPFDPSGSQGALQRARGRAKLETVCRDGQTRLARLYQDGCAKARLPKVHGGPELQAVLLNTAGGLTGGDILETEVLAGAGSAVVVTTQACERIYRAADGVARVHGRLGVADGAELQWVPQETILFDGGRIRRMLEVDMAGDASLLVVEPVVFGRIASGEVIGSGLFQDSWRVRRDGRLVFADETRLEGPIGEIINRPAVLAGARAAATVLRVAPDVGDLVEPARQLLTGATAGVSAFEQLLVCRVVAADANALRAVLIPLLSLLRGGGDLPRTWYL